jgi:hypothetical protein
MRQMFVFKGNFCEFALPMTVHISQATASITELQPNIGNSFSYTVQL